MKRRGSGSSTDMSKLTANWKDMAAINLKTCNATEPGQGWIIMNDGRIALDASKSGKKWIGRVSG